MRRTEFTKSTGTADFKLAQRRAIPILADWQSQVDHALAHDAQRSPFSSASTSGLDLEGIVAERGHDFVADGLLKLASKAARAGEPALADFRGKLLARIRLFNLQLVAEDVEFWSPYASKALARQDRSLDANSKEFHTFALGLGRAILDGFRKAVATIDGDESAYKPSSVVTRAKGSAEMAAKKGESIQEVFEEYAATCLAEGSKRQDTIEQDRKVIRLFAEFVGPTRSLRSIRRSDVYDWRKTLMSLPPKFKSKKGYADLCLRDAAAKAKAEGAKALSPTTINKYLSTVSPFLDWCVRFERAEANPCTGTFFDLKKGKNRRPSYSDGQLSQIVASPLFTGFQADGREHVIGDQHTRDWRFWIPLVCMFTGARISEIAQLRVQDIRCEHDLWFLYIIDDEATGQRTKSRLSRPAPLHSRLIALGFVDFWKMQVVRAATDLNSRLFPELKADARGNIGAGPSKFWRDYLTAIGIKKGRDGLGAHSFRHTIADQLRSAGYNDNEFNVLLGHSNKTVTSGYGALNQGTAKRFAEMIENVTFPSVNFAALSINTKTGF